MSDPKKDEGKPSSSDKSPSAGFRDRLRKLVKKVRRPKPSTAREDEAPEQEPTAKKQKSGIFSSASKFFASVELFFDGIGCLIVMILLGAFLISYALWMLKGCKGEAPTAPDLTLPSPAHQRNRPPPRPKPPAMYRLSEATPPAGPVRRR